ncbi:MAG: class I SAM-dependent methyltransferase [Cytophagales bacterium]|nr:class I SAM-dependent methyltransferase [Cytophagales bacterium]
MLHLFPQVNDPFHKTDLELVREKLKCLELKPSEILFDLGCGDASALIEAFLIYGVRGVGYECCPEVYRLAQDKVRNHGLTDKIQLFNKDLYQADLSSADALILYLSRSMLGKLSYKLEEELFAGVRIVTHSFDLPAWTIVRKEALQLSSGHIEEIFLYRQS